MAKRKTQKGPSWFEVGFGAFLAVILGLVLGALYLITKPVVTAKELPKDAPAGAIYFLEGARSASAGTVEEDKKKFLAGESIDVTEADVNVVIGDSGTTPKSGDKDKAAADKMITPGTLNTRIRNGTIQFAAPVDYNIFTIMGTVIVQASGTFEKRGNTFSFIPDSVLVGGLQIGRIPFAKDFVLSKLLFARPVPDDMANAWAKLGAISIDGSTLRLKMP